MVSLFDIPEIENLAGIYEGNIDQRIEQSAIYEKIPFTCVASAYPGIVLTPVCEIVSKNAPHITVAQIIPASFIFNVICEKEISEGNLTEDQMAGVEKASSGTKKNIAKEFEKYVKNQIYRYHFLPKCDDALQHSFIDFQVVESFKTASFKFNKKCQLMSPWRESIPARYAAYCLRIGVPSFSAAARTDVFNSISTLK